MASRTWSQQLGLLIYHLKAGGAVLWRMEARLKGVQFKGPCRMVGRPIIGVARDSQLIVGKGVTLDSALRSNPIGCFQPCVLRTMTPGAQLILGDQVGLSAAVLCAGAGIRVGEGTIFGSGAMVIDNDFHAREGEWGWRGEHASNARPIEIGRGVFVGARAIILKGVTIGDRAIVGAGAVVSKEVPGRHIAVGNPAQTRPLPTGALEQFNPSRHPTGKE